MSEISKPRVHWVSPLPAAQTDIAHYTRRILPELAAATELTLWTDATTWDHSLEQYCLVRRLDPDRITPGDFAKAGRGPGPDAIFVHIGNSWVFHSGFLRLVRRIPSIIVLHDIAIQECSFDAIHNGRFDRAVYENEMLRWYGAEGQVAAQRVFDGKLRPGALAHEFPGFEITLDRAASVVAHTGPGFQAVADRAMVPAYQLDLPFRPSAELTSATRSETGPLRFVQFGYIGPNRRLEEVLNALAPLREEVDFRFEIMGDVWDTDHIRRRIRALGLEERVQLNGFVPEAELDAKLAQAHLVFNLRYPTMGEASGSQLRIWNASAAAVVTDLGWYGDLPEDTVFKIPLEEEAEALQTLIRQINDDRGIAQQVGAAGRKRLESHHPPALYAQGIAHVAQQFTTDLPAALRARRARDVLAEAGKTASPRYQDRLLQRL